jgi:isopentenyldiphosphate isomerase
MSEIITACKTNDWENRFPIDRQEFYKQAIENGETSNIAVEIINVLIFNTKGELLIQKRSKNKTHNPGLFDKSIGGHVKYGDSLEYTLITETIEELLVPSLLIQEKSNFKKNLTQLRPYLNTIAIIKKLGIDCCFLKKIIKGKEISVGNKYHLFIGFYDGTIKLIDGEVSGLFWYELDDLNEEIQKSPQIFTNDLKFILKKYDTEIQSFLEILTEGTTRNDV